MYAESADFHVQSSVTPLSILGSGAFGDVLKAHTSTFGEVAVKIVKVSVCHRAIGCPSSQMGNLSSQCLMQMLITPCIVSCIL